MQVDSKPEELDSIDREIVRLQDRAGGAEEGAAIPARKERLKSLEKELAELEKHSADITARWKSEKEKLSDAQKLKTELDQLAHRARQCAAQGRVPARRRARLWPHSRAREEAQGDRGRRRQGRHGGGGGDRRPHRAGGLALDRRAGRPDARRREGEAPAHGGAARQARRRPGRGRQGGVDRGAPRPRRACRTRTGRSARSCSSGRPASARPS